MEIKEGMHVRTKDDELYKCVIIHIDNNNPSLNRFMNEWGNMIMFDEIEGEPSFDIIKLLKPGDLVTLTSKYCEGEIYRVIEAYDDMALVDCFMDGSMNIDNDDIESVVTKEMFNGCKYEVQHESTN